MPISLPRVPSTRLQRPPSVFDSKVQKMATFVTTQLNAVSTRIDAVGTAVTTHATSSATKTDEIKRAIEAVGTTIVGQTTSGGVKADELKTAIDNVARHLETLTKSLPSYPNTPRKRLFPLLRALNTLEDEVIDRTFTDINTENDEIRNRLNQLKSSDHFRELEHRHPALARDLEKLFWPFNPKSNSQEIDDARCARWKEIHIMRGRVAALDVP